MLRPNPNRDLTSNFPLCYRVSIRETKMKKSESLIYSSVFILFLSIICMGAQEVKNDLIKPDRTTIYRDSEGPPSFTIKADPNALICVEVATENKIFEDLSLQNDENYFSSDQGGHDVEAVEIKTDEKGEALYKLPKKPWDALTSKTAKVNIVKLYYRALVIQPLDNPEEFEILAWSFKDEDWEKAPLIEVFEEVGMGNAYDQFNKAEEFFKQGEYEKAIKEYESAWFYWPTPGLLYCMGYAYLHLAYESFEDCVADSVENKKHLENAQYFVGKLREILPEIDKKK